MVEEGILNQKEQTIGKRMAYLYCLNEKGEKELKKLIRAIKIKKEVLLDPLIK